MVASQIRLSRTECITGHLKTRQRQGLRVSRKSLQYATSFLLDWLAIVDGIFHIERFLGGFVSPMLLGDEALDLGDPIGDSRM
jgi:hypothetical protein